MLVFVLLALPISSQAASYKEKQFEKGKILQRQHELRLEQQKMQRALDQHQEKVDQILGELRALNEEEAKLAKEMKEAEQQYLAITAKIDELNVSIAKIQGDFDERLDVSGQRLRSMQQTDTSNLSMMYFVANASSFSDLFNRVDAVQTIFEAERALLNRIRADQLKIEELKKEQLDALEDVDYVQLLLETQRELVFAQQERKQSILQALETTKEQLSNEQLVVKKELANELERLAVVQEEMLQLQSRERWYAKNELLINGKEPVSPMQLPESVELVCQSDIQIDALNQKLESAGKMKGTASTIVKVAERNNIDPVVFTAIMLHETGKGTSKAIQQYNNPGGMMNPKTNWSTLIQYPSLEAGYESTAKTISRLMNKGGLSTIEKLGAVYAPIGASNDARGLNRFWAPSVKKFANDLGGVRCQTS